MNQNFQKLKVLWSTTEEFQEFMNRKESHDDFEKNVTYSTLPNLFPNDAESKFNKNFVKQWLPNKLLPLVLAANPLSSKYFPRWLLKTPTEDFFVTYDSH